MPSVIGLDAIKRRAKAATGGKKSGGRWVFDPPLRGSQADIDLLEHSYTDIHYLITALEQAETKLAAVGELRDAIKAVMDDIEAGLDDWYTVRGDESALARLRRILQDE